MKEALCWYGVTFLVFLIGKTLIPVDENGYASDPRDVAFWVMIVIVPMAAGSAAFIIDAMEGQKKRSAWQGFKNWCDRKFKNVDFG